MEVCLKNLTELTEQEVFDHVAMALLKQGEQSLGGHLSTCMYRGPGGLKCAAGHIMADDEYKEDFERHAWRELVDEGRVPAKHAGLIDSLQSVHDDDHAEEWPGDLEHLARSWGLNSDVIQQYA